MPSASILQSAPHIALPEPVPAPASAGGTRKDRSAADLAFYALLVGLVCAAWYVSRLSWFKPGGNPSYWIGVAGVTLISLLFSYPLRKHARFMRRLGPVKKWFWLHMTMGILGPWLILVHSTFRIGSLNARVALYSMVVVVVSGVIGRFIYTRVHRGLDGERTTLRELQQRAGFVESAARSRLHFAPEVEAALVAFEQRELDARPGWATYLRQVTLLPCQQWLAHRRCVHALRKPLRAHAKERHWSRTELIVRKRQCAKLVGRYLDSVVSVAQYTAYERVFALWHMAHLPFVYLLIVSAVVHVVAVHAY